MIHPFFINFQGKLIEHSFFEELRTLAMLQQRQRANIKAMRELLDQCSYTLGSDIRRLYETPSNDQ